MGSAASVRLYRNAGWIASIVLPSLRFSVLVQHWPKSRLSSMWTNQPPCSVLDPQSNVPSARSTGLFLIGPRIPCGRRRGFDQLLPWSSEVISMPHHFSGLWPTLWQSMRGPRGGCNEQHARQDDESHRQAPSIEDGTGG